MSDAGDDVGELLLPVVLAVRDRAMALVADDRGVRVEDYLTVVAAATGEAALEAAALFDIEDNDLTPGAAVFGDAINERLSGDAVDPAAAGPTTVVGVLRDWLVPDVVDLADLGPIEDHYRLVAEHVGAVPWGAVAVTVADDHRPSVQPIRAAFELRPAVEAADRACVEVLDAGGARPAGWGRHTLCAMALASAVQQTAAALDPRVGVRLALEVCFGMAKTVPVPRSAFDDVAGGPAGD